MILKIYSILQSKTGYSSFGEKSVIKFPYKTWGKKKIEIGKGTFIAENSFLSAVESWEGENFKPLLKIGDNVTIGSGFFATCVKKIEIKDNVLISDRVFISDHIHDYENIKKPISKQKLKFKGEVIIKEGSFIGINSVIMPGVTIGKNSVVGASSVVTKDVPDYSVVVGNPAKLIRKAQNGKWLKKK